MVLIPQQLRVLASSCDFTTDSDLVPIGEHLTPLPQLLGEWSAGTGAAFLDLSKPLQAVAETGTLVWPADDTHWNAEGIKAATTAISTCPG